MTYAVRIAYRIVGRCTTIRYVRVDLIDNNSCSRSSNFNITTCSQISPTIVVSTHHGMEYEASVTICVALVIARPILLTKLYYILVNFDILYLYFILTQLKLPNDVVLLYIRIKEVSISNTFFCNAIVL